MNYEAVDTEGGLSPLREFRKSLPEAGRKMVLGPEHMAPLVIEARLGEPVGVLSEGLGMNFPPSFQKNQDRAFPTTEADWQRLLAHVDWLGLKILRYWLWGEAVFPQPNALQREHEYFHRLRRLDAWAQSRGGRLILDLSGMPAWLRFSVPADEPDVFALMAAPRDVREYVDGFAMPLIKYVVHELKLESVRYLCLVNEPFNVDFGLDTFYTPRGVDPFGHYIELHAELRRRLDEEGISRERLGLIGPDSHDLYIEALGEMRRRGFDLLPHVEIMDEHAYRMRLDYQPPAHHMPTTTITQLMDAMKKSIAVAREASKPYLLTEYSCFYYPTFDGATRHDSALTEAEFVIRSLAEGAAGALRYSLINSGEADGRWQCVNTMDGSYAPSPNIYYAFAVLSRYAPRGANVRRLELHALPNCAPYVHGVALEYPDDITVLLVNDHPGEIITLDLISPSAKPFVAWQTDATYKHRAIEVEQSDKSTRLVLPPMSVTAVTTFDLKPDAPGLVDAPR